MMETFPREGETLADEIERLRAELELRRAFERDQEAEVERLREEKQILVEGCRVRDLAIERLGEALERIAGKHDGHDSECVRCQARAAMDDAG